MARFLGFFHLRGARGRVGTSKGPPRPMEMPRKGKNATKEENVVLAVRSRRENRHLFHDAFSASFRRRGRCLFHGFRSAKSTPLGGVETLSPEFPSNAILSSSPTKSGFLPRVVSLKGSEKRFLVVSLMGSIGFLPRVVSLMNSIAAELVASRLSTGLTRQETALGPGERVPVCDFPRAPALVLVLSLGFLKTMKKPQETPMLARHHPASKHNETSPKSLVLALFAP